VEAWLDEHPLLAGRVIVLGHVSEDDLPAVTRGSATLVSSSEWEGFGLTLLQAMIGGVPVVAVSNSSLPEIAGGHAAFSASAQPNALAASLAVALDMPETLRKDAALHARGFSWHRCARETLACYEVA
jgi:glycosyltransferase involved in cell wall biosynthesis